MAAGVLHRVERAHDQARAIADDPDLPLQLDEGKSERACPLLDLLVGAHFLPIAELGLPVERVVVDVELRVTCEQRTVGLDEERIDLDQRRVGLHVDVVEALRDVGHGVALFGRYAGLEAERARLVGKEAEHRVGPAARDLLGRARGDLLDVHTADRREHHHRAPLVAVERDAEVELLRDVRGALDVDLADPEPLDLHVQDRARVRTGLGRGVGDLDAAGLAAAASVNLRLHHDGAAERARRSLGLLGRGRDATFGDADAGTGEQLLRLIFVELHGVRRGYRRWVRRVSVVGGSCSGKTTFSRDLALILNVPFVELDALAWQANWIMTDVETFQDEVRKATAGDAWVVDGNYGGRGARDIVWARADAVVWLDLPLPLTLVRMWRRTTDRIGRKEPLWGGNQESIRNTFLSRESLFVWAIKTHRRRRRILSATMTRPDLGHLTFHRLRSPTEVARWLAAQRDPQTR